MTPKYANVGCILATNSQSAELAYSEIAKKYDVQRIDMNEVTDSRDDLNTSAEKYDLILSIGGDGTMLRAIHASIKSDTPIYGINRGSLGFLLNEYNLEHLGHNIDNASAAVINPLVVKVKMRNGEVKKALAINEVSLLRQMQESANLEIMINGNVYLRKLVSDGVMIATPTGSSAYNFAAHGPIVPLDANLLLLTPISPFRPRRWHGAMIPKQSRVVIKNISPDKRPVSAAADFYEFRDAIEIEAYIDFDIKIQLLFDYYSSFHDRVIREQFAC